MSAHETVGRDIVMSMNETTGNDIAMSTHRIAGHDLVPGRTIKDHIHVNGTTIHVPHVIISGDPAGPTLLITAGIHNAEFVGIQAAIELSREIDPEDLRGTVVIVPLANPSGFENRTMSLVYEDGRNLNRVFPGDRQGTEAYRLAYMLFHSFIKNSDAYIDLHSGDGFEELTPYVYYVGDTDVSEESAAMAACVDVKYCVKSRCKTGGAYNLASVNGVPSVLIERGQLSQLPREQVEQDKADVLNIMKHLGILRKRSDMHEKRSDMHEKRSDMHEKRSDMHEKRLDIHEKRSDIHEKRSDIHEKRSDIPEKHSDIRDGDAAIFDKQILRETEMHAPATGCWYPSKHAGDSFRKGEVLGVIKDYFGETLHEVISPEDGVILYQTVSLNILKDGPMISYGVPDRDLI